MTRILFATASLALLLCQPAYAATSSAKTASAPASTTADAPVGINPDGLPRWNRAPQTRQEMIGRTKARLAALEKMTDAEWETKRKEIQERRMQRNANRSGPFGSPPAAPAAPAMTPAPAKPAAK